MWKHSIKMMDDDGLTRYDLGNPSKDFFGKDRYIKYVSSEASGIEEEEDDQPQLPQQYMMYQPYPYQTTEYVAANALYKSRALLEELHHFELGKAAPAAPTFAEPEGPVPA